MEKKDKLTDEELLEELKSRFREKKESLDELQRLMDQLKDVNRKLAESEQLKSHFISNITNEIINPFTSILGLSRNIMSMKDKNWDKVLSMAKLIHSEAFSLDFQLKNIFAAAEIEAGETVPQVVNVDVSLLIKNVIEAFSFEAEKKEIKVTFNDRITVDKGSTFTFCTDPEKLQIMLSNLLDNAIKFSSAASKIEIKAWLKNDVLNISVRDHGIGISEENKKIIFDRFKRLDSGINSLNRGHGLGLSINKAFLDLLNGNIEVKSQLKRGSVFTIMIPESKSEDKIQDFAADGSETFFGGDSEIF
jgi:signal transduction histidine kinase